MPDSRRHQLSWPPPSWCRGLCRAPRGSKPSVRLCPRRARVLVTAGDDPAALRKRVPEREPGCLYGAGGGRAGPCGSPGRPGRRAPGNSALPSRNSVRLTASLLSRRVLAPKCAACGLPILPPEVRGPFRPRVSHDRNFSQGHLQCLSLVSSPRSPSSLGYTPVPCEPCDQGRLSDLH